LKTRKFNVTALRTKTFRNNFTDVARYAIRNILLCIFLMSTVFISSASSEFKTVTTCNTLKGRV